MRQRPRPAGSQTLIVALAAVAAGAVLLLSGALDEHTPVDINPSSTGTVVATTIDPSQSVMIRYLTEQKAWNDCVIADQSGATCGTAPAQPDDPRLNAYLADVLDWNKCAAPRLRRGGMDTAIVACGPQPESPLGG